MLFIEKAFRAKLAMFTTDTADGPQVPPESERPKTQIRPDRGTAPIQCDRQECAAITGTASGS